MPKFVKKPVVIEAVQFSHIDEDNSKQNVAVFKTERPEWLDAAIRSGDIRRAGSGLSVDTAEGTIYARSGDWIIQGIKGELYPCKPDIFAEIYESYHD